MITVVEADLTLPEHAQAVLQLLEHYARDPMGGGQGLSNHTRSNLINALLERPGCHIVLAFDDAEPAGLTNCFEGFSTFACRPLLNIHDVVVAAEHRGKGISRLMLEKVEEMAKRLNCCKLTLEVLEGNKVAQSAYLAIGFSGYELDPAMGRALFWEKKLN
ncbi:MAG: GNAT family N-acetyltransferase [Pseudomonas sp.]